MKKFLLLSLMLLVGGMIFNASAAKVPGTEYTSVEQLAGKTFAIINKTDGKAICNKKGSNDYDLQYLPYAEAFSADVTAYLFKIEQVVDADDAAANGKYLIRPVKEDGSTYTFYGWATSYFQTNTTGTGVCFFFDLSFQGHKRGADADNTGTWDIQYDAEKGGWKLKNVGTSKYYNDPTKDAMSDTPGYFTFCEVVENGPTITIENPANLVEITQENVETGFTAAEKVVESGYTTYTTKSGEEGHLNIAIKTKDIDVDGCDYVVTKFAEPIVAAGWVVAFWGNNSTEEIKVGDTEYKLVFANDPLSGHPTAFKSAGVLKEITMMTLWTNGPITAKVKGIYKHKVTETIFSRTYSFDKALDFTSVEGLEAYAITAFNKDNKTLTLTRVYKAPANTGLYLVGKDGDYAIPTIESATAIDGNLLVASGDGTITQTDGTKTNLVLATVGENRGFYPLSGDGNMGTNKAYLQLPTADLTSGAPFRFIYDDEEPTAIAEVNDTKVADDAWYTINGVKLEGEPTEKGIYIYNGKKVAIQ